jgi:tetratricopeptide (TPR) repeat protein
MDYLRAHAGLQETGNEPEASRSEAGDEPDVLPPEPVAPQPAIAENGPAAPVVSVEDFVRQAEEAQARGDWSEAERIWRAIRQVIPLWNSFVGGGVSLARLGRYDEARQLLSEGAVAFPHERAYPIELGRIAISLEDWPTAEMHWRAALQRDPRTWWIYTELAGVLDRQGRFGDAEAVLAEAREQCDEPNEITLFTYPARLAWKREDWVGAVARWAEAKRRFPKDEDVTLRFHEAFLRLAEHDPAAAVAAHRDLGLTSAKDDLQALMLRFESLGGTGPAGGCEFGGVQRILGCEPLGLFRWATVRPANLIACLEDRFRTIGDVATTSVRPHEEQWEIWDADYGTSMHSFVSRADVPEDRMTVLACKRMRFLREKLIADLDAAEKIFVLKVASEPLTVAETEALSRAIQTYGAAELLCVCPADADHREGEIVRAAPGIFIGYIDFSSGLNVAARHGAWQILCRTMLALSVSAHKDTAAPLMAG